MTRVLVFIQANLDRPLSLDELAGVAEGTDRVRLESLAEGRCVQALHVGPYDREHETLAVMREFASAQGLEFHGRHHEVYLSDPRRVPPERLKTILRMPVRRAR